MSQENNAIDSKMQADHTTRNSTSRPGLTIMVDVSSVYTFTYAYRSLLLIYRYLTIAVLYKHIRTMRPTPVSYEDFALHLFTLCFFFICTSCPPSGLDSLQFVNLKILNI